MTILKKDFFTNNQVLFIGLSSNPKSFSRSVYRDFVKYGIEVFPMNAITFKMEGAQIISDVKQLPQVPETAYILLNSDNTKRAVKSLEGTSVKRVLFHSKSTVDETTIRACEAMGIETYVACPKMMISSAPIHKIHGFFAGVR